MGKRQRCEKMISEDHSSYDDLTSLESLSPTNDFYQRFSESIVFHNNVNSSSGQTETSKTNSNSIFSNNGSSSLAIGSSYDAVSSKQQMQAAGGLKGNDPQNKNANFMFTAHSNQPQQQKQKIMSFSQQSLNAPANRLNIPTIESMASKSWGWFVDAETKDS